MSALRLGSRTACRVKTKQGISMTRAHAARAVAFAPAMAAGDWPAPTPAVPPRTLHAPTRQRSRRGHCALRTRLVVTGIDRACGVRQVGRSAVRQILQRQPLVVETGALAADPGRTRSRSAALARGGGSDSLRAAWPQVACTRRWDLDRPAPQQRGVPPTCATRRCSTAAKARPCATESSSWTRANRKQSTHSSHHVDGDDVHEPLCGQMGSLTASRIDLGPMTLMTGGHGNRASARRSGSDLGRRNC